MSQLSFSSFDDALLVRDAQGRYLPASVDQILEAARQAIELKMQRGAEFTSPAPVKEYLRNKLAGFEHEVFAVLFLDTRHRLIEYREMFHGTIDSASVYPREVVKEALRLNAAVVILSHIHPSGNPEPSQGRAGAGGGAHAGSRHRGGRSHNVVCRTRSGLSGRGGLRPPFHRATKNLLTNICYIATISNMTNIARDFATTLRAIRTELNLTQEQLAARLGVSFATVNR